MTEVQKVVKGMAIIDGIISKYVDPSDLAGLLQNLLELKTVLPNACDLEARSKMLMLRAMKVNMVELLTSGDKHPPTIINKLTEAMSADEVGLHTKAVRTARAITHAIDAMRTSVSAVKAEISQLP